MARESKTRRRSDRGAAVRFRRYVIAISAAAVVALTLIAVATLVDGGDDGEGGGPVVLPSPRPADIAQEGHALGSGNAPVTVIEYADFQ